MSPVLHIYGCPSIKQQKQTYNGKANDVGMVYNEQTESFMCLQVLVNKSPIW